MTTKNIQILKEQLKDVGLYLKEKKLEYKKQQSYVDKNNIDWFGTADEKLILRKLWSLEKTVWNRQKYYRIYHIAYSLMKGIKYEKIEPFVRQGNEPDWDFIKEVTNEYAR